MKVHKTFTEETEAKRDWNDSRYHKGTDAYLLELAVPTFLSLTTAHWNLPRSVIIRRWMSFYIALYTLPDERLSVRAHPMGRSLCHRLFGQRQAQFPRSSGNFKSIVKAQVAIILHQLVIGKQEGFRPFQVIFFLWLLIGVY